MSAVYPSAPAQPRGKRLLLAVAKASTLHVGAAAAAASLRDDLTKNQIITEDRFNELFAVGRLTPGTTLLALQTLVGYSVSGWPAALATLAVATALPSAITVAVVVLYSHYSAVPAVRQLMDGAQAGAFAVFVWAAVRLAAPVILRHRTTGIALTVLLAALVMLDVLHPIVVLMIAAVLGSLLLRAAR